jgi:hypothetical protein
VSRPAREVFTDAEIAEVEKVLEGRRLARVNPTHGGSILIEVRGMTTRRTEIEQALEELGLIADWDPGPSPTHAGVQRAVHFVLPARPGRRLSLAEVYADMDACDATIAASLGTKPKRIGACRSWATTAEPEAKLFLGGELVAQVLAGFPWQTRAERIAEALHRDRERARPRSLPSTDRHPDGSPVVTRMVFSPMTLEDDAAVREVFEKSGDDVQTWEDAMREVLRLEVEAGR